LAITVHHGTTRAGDLIIPAIQLTAQDALENTDPGFTDTVMVAIGTDPGGDRLSGTTRVAAVSGLATFSNVSIDKAGDGYTLTASAPIRGVSDATSGAFSIMAADAGRLAIVTQPSTGARSDVPFEQQPAIQLQDANGNAVSQVGVVVTAAVASGATAATLVGGSTAT